ncbi:hypothetical protein KA068_02575 [Candidatus Saccharibacteria bacterium]|jgi:hypothetical protein|nr:hypothetical protein [Candidatus Saccharibacteria bacterium]
MNTTEQILLIILSSTLAIFLILAIVAIVAVIKLVKQLQHITQKAESIADKAEMVSNFVGKTAGPVAVGKLLLGIVESVKSHTDKAIKNQKGRK